MQWDATTIVAVTTAVNATIGALIAAYLKLRSVQSEDEKAEDDKIKSARSELVEQLRQQVKELKGEVQSVLSELKDVRAERTKCEIEQAKLQGKLDTQSERMNTMQIQIDGLLKHNKNNVDHVRGLQQAVVHIDPSTAPDLLK